MKNTKIITLSSAILTSLVLFGTTPAFAAENQAVQISTPEEYKQVVEDQNKALDQYKNQKASYDSDQKVYEEALKTQETDRLAQEKAKEAYAKELANYQADKTTYDQAKKEHDQKVEKYQGDLKEYQAALEKNKEEELKDDHPYIVKKTTEKFSHPENYTASIDGYGVAKASGTLGQNDYKVVFQSQAGKESSAVTDFDEEALKDVPTIDLKKFPENLTFTLKHLYKTADGQWHDAHYKVELSDVDVTLSGTHYSKLLQTFSNDKDDLIYAYISRTADKDTNRAENFTSLGSSNFKLLSVSASEESPLTITPDSSIIATHYHFSRAIKLPEDRIINSVLEHASNPGFFTSVLISDPTFKKKSVIYNLKDYFDLSKSTFVPLAVLPSKPVEPDAFTLKEPVEPKVPEELTGQPLSVIEPIKPIEPEINLYSYVETISSQLNNRPVEAQKLVEFNLEDTTLTSEDTDGLHLDEKGNLVGTPKVNFEGMDEEKDVTIPVHLSNKQTPDLDLKVTVNVLRDTDGDGIPDTTDSDDDNDGYSDEEELKAGSNPKDANSIPSMKLEHTAVTKKLTKPMAKIEDIATKKEKVDEPEKSQSSTFEEEKGQLAKPLLPEKEEKTSKGNPIKEEKTTESEASYPVEKAQPASSQVKPMKKAATLPQTGMETSASLLGIGAALAAVGFASLFFSGFFFKKNK